MNTKLREDALMVTYNDLEKMINKIVWKFYYQYGGEFADWKAEAHLIYMKAYEDHDESKAQFITCLYKYLMSGLRDYYHRFISKNQPSTVNEYGWDSMLALPDNVSPFAPIDLFDEVTADAQELIKLIWDMPDDLRKEKLKTINRNYHRANRYAIHMKVFLTTYLRKIGWTKRRIKETFKEIGEALYV